MMRIIALYHLPIISRGSEAEKKGGKKIRKKRGQDKTREGRLEGKRKR